jgi:hypothetical protein
VYYSNYTIIILEGKRQFSLGQIGGGKTRIGTSILTRSNQTVIPDQSRFQTILNYYMWNGPRSGPKRTSP